MEKTFAREVYKHMVVGTVYKLSDLMELVDVETRLQYFPQIKGWEDLKAFDFKHEFRKAMGSIVGAGYATTTVMFFEGYCTRGQKYGTGHQAGREYHYKARVWVRVK